MVLFNGLGQKKISNVIGIYIYMWKSIIHGCVCTYHWIIIVDWDMIQSHKQYHCISLTSLFLNHTGANILLMEKVELHFPPIIFCLF